MKVRVLVEVIEGGKTVARKVRQTEVSSKAVKLYEVMGRDDVTDFIAEDVISGALKAVQDSAMPGATEAILNSQPAVDEQGQSKGMTKLDEALGLDVIDHMLKKGIA
jgi:hypothetical protein